MACACLQVCFGSAGFLVALFACRLPAPPRPASAGSAAGLEQLSAVNLRHTLAKAALVAVAIVIAAVPHMSGAPHPHVGAIDIVETHTTCGSTHARCEPTPQAPHSVGARASRFVHTYYNERLRCACCRCERSGPPSEMAASFSVWCLATAFAYWLVLGVAASAAFNATSNHDAGLQPSPTSCLLLILTLGLQALDERPTANASRTGKSLHALTRRCMDAPECDAQWATSNRSPRSCPSSPRSSAQEKPPPAPIRQRPSTWSSTPPRRPQRKPCDGAPAAAGSHGLRSARLRLSRLLFSPQAM